jgi:hypothetical protein
MVVGSIFTKKRNFGFYRVTHGRRGQLKRKKWNFGFFAQIMVVGSIFTKKRNFGFIRAKSWSAGQFSRKNINLAFFRLDHGRRVKSHEKPEFRFFSR